MEYSSIFPITNETIEDILENLYASFIKIELESFLHQVKIE